MSLIGFHRVLIFTAILFSGGFAIRQLSEYRATGNGWVLITAVALGIVAVALGFYLRHLRDFLRLPAPGGAARPSSGTPASRSGNGNNRPMDWNETFAKPKITPEKENGRDSESLEAT